MTTVKWAGIQPLNIQLVCSLLATHTASHSSLRSASVRVSGAIHFTGNFAALPQLPFLKELFVYTYTHSDKTKSVVHIRDLEAILEVGGNIFSHTPNFHNSHVISGSQIPV